jgi:hypothetical protein
LHNNYFRLLLPLFSRLLTLLILDLSDEPHRLVHNLNLAPDDLLLLSEVLLQLVLLEVVRPRREDFVAEEPVIRARLLLEVVLQLVLLTPE